MRPAVRQPWTPPVVQPLRTTVDAAYDLSPLNLSRLLDGLMRVISAEQLRACAAAFADDSVRHAEYAARHPDSDPTISRRGVEAYSDLAERVSDLAWAARPEVAGAIGRVWANRYHPPLGEA